MQLEDHAGDILRKARTMNGLPAAVVATAGGISEARLAECESTGQFQGANLSALATAAGLNPGKFTAIANGWLPAPKNLTRWRQLRVFTTSGEGLTVNCFLAWDETTREAALFDTGLDARPVLDQLANENLQLRHIFITHSHWDHVEALPEIRAAFPQAQLHSGSRNAPAAQRMKPGEIISVGGLRVAHRETPGHAEDGVTYLVAGWPDNAPAVAMAGDTIFAGSMGHGNQSWELARQKIREHILTLPDETLLCPGHGPLTSVGEERMNNPFF